MDDAAAVCRFNGIGDLPRDRHRRLDRNATTLIPRRRPVDDICKRRPLDQLHHEREPVRRVLDAVDSRDAGVIQRREELRFALEALEAFRIPGDGGRQDLDRHVPTQSPVVCAVDLAHAAGAQRRDDFKRPDAISGGKRHGRQEPS